MGLSVVLETESGEEVERVDDPGNVLHRLLPGADDRSFSLLRFIDWYGDTVFNQLQMESFRSEWERLDKNGESLEEKALLDRVDELARRSQQEPHLYLKFYGD
jgi:hypothetical protein